MYKYLATICFSLLAIVHGGAASPDYNPKINSQSKYNNHNTITSQYGEFYLAQLTEYKSFYIELSYNQDKAEMLNEDVLSKALRQMTTIFIGSGFTYVEREAADLIARVYLDIDVSDYKRGSETAYDLLSKVTIKLYDKDEKLLDEVNKNSFVKGHELRTIMVDSISKSSSEAARQIVSGLEKDTPPDDVPIEVPVNVKIEIVFEGAVTYKLFENVDSVIKNASTKVKVLKRTINYGSSINMLVLSGIQSQRLAELIIDRVSNKSSLDVINVTDNRVVFRVN